MSNFLLRIEAAHRSKAQCTALRGAGGQAMETPHTSSSPSAAGATGNGRPLRVLVVEDSEDDAILLVRELRRGGYHPVWQRVETADAMKVAISQQSWDVVICDHGMPHFSAPRALRLLREHELDLPFIIVSGTIGEEL